LANWARVIRLPGDVAVKLVTRNGRKLVPTPRALELQTSDYLIATDGLASGAVDLVIGYARAMQPTWQRSWFVVITPNHARSALSIAAFLASLKALTSLYAAAGAAPAARSGGG
jgi:hypothetical protein